MKKHLSAKTKWLIVIAVLLAGLVTVTAAMSRSNPGESLVQTVLTPFRSAASGLVRQIERYYDYVFRYESLQDFTSPDYGFTRENLTTMLGEHSLMEDPDGPPEAFF